MSTSSDIADEVMSTLIFVFVFKILGFKDRTFHWVDDTDFIEWFLSNNANVVEVINNVIRKTITNKIKVATLNATIRDRQNRRDHIIDDIAYRRRETVSKVADAFKKVVQEDAVADARRTFLALKERL